MIHSMAGGELGNDDVFDFAKLEFDCLKGQFFWYISTLSNISQGDHVLAPFGRLDELKLARVIRIDRGVKASNFPIPVKRMKYIFSKSNNNQN